MFVFILMLQVPVVHVKTQKFSVTVPYMYSTHNTRNVLWWHCPFSPPPFKIVKFTEEVGEVGEAPPAPAVLRHVVVYEIYLQDHHVVFFY